MISKILRSTLCFAFLMVAAFSYSQKVVGQVVDAFGIPIDPGIKINSNNVTSINGEFELEYHLPSYLHISYNGYFDIEVQVKTNAELTSLGDIYMIENANWIDGPKNGILKDYYPSGAIKYIREVRNWKLHGVSEFYNIEGKLTQRIQFKKGMPIIIDLLRDYILSRLDFRFDRKRQLITILQ